MSERGEDQAELRPGDEEELAAVDDAVIGRAFRGSLVAFIVLVAVGIAVLLWLRSDQAPAEVVIDKQVTAPAALIQDDDQRPVIAFVDVTAAAGIDFVHSNGAAGDKLLPETMGGGVAWLDYDVDGDPDLLFVNSRRWHGGDATSRLYENDGDGTFADVSRDRGLDVSMYGMGVAVADYDDDGDPDVFLAALGANVMLRNDGGRYVDVTADAGVAGDETSWSSSAGFFDYDRDGDLDLFVCNYVRWSEEIDRDLNFSLNGKDRAYGPPTNFVGTFSKLYRNDGGGHFSDVSAAAGIEIANPYSGEPIGKALALGIADLDGDGWLDVMVANDTTQNFLFHNRGDGTFEEVGTVAGLAYDGMGRATGAMGVDVADYRNDGTLGIAIGNFANEPTSLFASRGSELAFTDLGDVEGIGSLSRLALSFGVMFLDVDLDGRLDLLQANGHLEEEINSIQPSQHYRQSAQLFWNAGANAKSCYVALPSADVGDLDKPIVGRGAAYADYDGDGDLDVVLTQTGDAPMLLRNDQALGNHWLRVELIGAAGNRDQIGAWIELRVAGVTQRRQIMPTRSYLSQVERTVTFGLGTATSVDAMTVHWADGTQLDVAVPAVDRVMRIEQTNG